LSSILTEKVDEGTIQRLIGAAIKAREMAYAPYSKFKVGAAILATSGQVFTGCNIENASYGGTCCAERVALFKAVSHGEREFLAMALVTDTEEPSSPCGLCRQVLAEFGTDMFVISANGEGRYRKEKLIELFPRPFVLNESQLPLG
jgi:cytidine deaminase